MAVSSTGAIFAPNFLIYCGLRFLSAFGLAGIIMTQGTLSESHVPAPALGWQEVPGPHLYLCVLLRLAVAEWTTTHRRAVALTILGCTYSTGQMALAGLAFALRDWRDLQLVVSVPLLAISLISWSVWCGTSSHGRPGLEVCPFLPLTDKYTVPTRGKPQEGKDIHHSEFSDGCFSQRPGAPIRPG
jgi:hypothetical protein